jgi:hypothetical protein
MTVDRYPKVRIGGRRERVPVQVTLGVRGNGERVVLDLRLVGEESAASWTEVVANLTAQHLARPVLAIIDGNSGLMNALQSHWPGIAIQRCTAHKIMEPAVESAGAAAGGAHGGLPPHDLRRHRCDRSAVAHALHQEMAAALPRRGGEPDLQRRSARSAQQHYAWQLRRRVATNPSERLKTPASMRKRAAESLGSA